jgi:hypothetical protein
MSVLHFNYDVTPASPSSVKLVLVKVKYFMFFMATFFIKNSKIESTNNDIDQ